MVENSGVEYSVLSATAVESISSREVELSNVICPPGSVETPGCKVLEPIKVFVLCGTAVLVDVLSIARLEEEIDVD